MRFDVWSFQLTLNFIPSTSNLRQTCLLPGRVLAVAHIDHTGIHSYSSISVDSIILHTCRVRIISISFWAFCVACIVARNIAKIKKESNQNDCLNTSTLIIYTVSSVTHLLKILFLPGMKQGHTSASLFSSSNQSQKKSIWLACFSRNQLVTR